MQSEGVELLLSGGHTTVSHLFVNKQTNVHTAQRGSATFYNRKSGNNNVNLGSYPRYSYGEL